MSAKIFLHILILLYCAKWKCALSLTYENDQLVDIRNSLASISKDVQGINKKFDSLASISKDVQGINKKFESLETELDRTAKNLSNQIEESKRDIVNIMKEQRRDIEFFQIFNRTEDERNIATKNQDGGCGGVVIGDEGFISFSSQSFGNRTGEFRCIWTVRANRFEKVAFKLISGNIDFLSTTSSLSLMSLKTMNKQNVTYARNRDDSRKILGTNLYIMEGPVVFVTFISTYNSDPTNFILKYEGRGNNTSAEINYRHYHYEELAGEIDYPRLRDAETYSPNEMVTFVINPQNLKFHLNLLYVDLQTSSFCEYDTLTIFYPTLTFYLPWGVKDKDYRYCEKDSKFTNYKVGTGSKPMDAFIVTFKSDGSSQETGFRLSWPYPV